MDKKPNHLGHWALTTALLSGLLLFVALGNLTLGTFSAGDIRFAIVGAWLTVALALVGLALSVAGFFRKGEKKGLVGTACLISVVFLLLAGTMGVAYRYMFGTLKQDETFEQEDLYIVTPQEDGEIDLTPVPPETTLPPEEVKKKMQILELEYLVNEDIPEYVLSYMDRYDPVCYSVLQPEAEQVRNYLLFGLDDYNSSDSVVLVSLDSLHKKVKMFSLPRDSYVLIPEWGTYTKLTYAYSTGGPTMAVGTVNYNLSLNVRDYVSLKFDEVEQLIDLVGGVTVNMGYAEWEYMTECKVQGLNVGPCHLDGKTAVFYMRLRETDSELRRMERQREVLYALYEAAMQLPVEKYPELVRSGMEMCTTSLDSYSLLSLLLEAVQGGYSLKQYGMLDLIEYWGGSFNDQGAFYVVYDLDYASDTLYRLIYEDYYTSGYSDIDQQKEG